MIPRLEGFYRHARCADLSESWVWLRFRSRIPRNHLFSLCFEEYGLRTIDFPCAVNRLKFRTPPKPNRGGRALGPHSYIPHTANCGRNVSLAECFDTAVETFWRPSCQDEPSTRLQKCWRWGTRLAILPEMFPEADISPQ